MRAADPLRILTRQWQTGEFVGQGTGSPLVVDLTHSAKAMDRVRLIESGLPPERPSAPGLANF